MASLVVAAVALYAPAEPWPSLFILWWCVPLFAATAFDLHRRRLAQELRRDLLAKQRLAAIGEVSARIVHQSRHQVGIMGWSIHHLRPLVGRSDPEAVAVANAELDALAEAKDRLGAMLASELLAERATTPDEALEPPTSQVALADLVADVVAELGPGMTSAGVELRLDLGATDGSAAVPPALRDVAFNLVDNAIDAAASEVVVRRARRCRGPPRHRRRTGAGREQRPTCLRAVLHDQGGRHRHGSGHRRCRRGGAGRRRHLPALRWPNRLRCHAE
ncbi:MAG: hypothetical protein R2699_05865 [Acidimicrobiales bacterium]